jgi:hypothetical protein
VSKSTAIKYIQLYSRKGRSSASVGTDGLWLLWVYKLWYLHFLSGHNEISKSEDSESGMEEYFVCLLLLLVSGEISFGGCHDFQVQCVE